MCLAEPVNASTLLYEEIESERDLVFFPKKIPLQSSVRQCVFESSNELDAFKLYHAYGVYLQCTCTDKVIFYS